MFMPEYVEEEDSRNSEYTEQDLEMDLRVLVLGQTPHGTIQHGGGLAPSLCKHKIGINRDKYLVECLHYNVYTINL